MRALPGMAVILLLGFLGMTVACRRAEPPEPAAPDRAEAPRRLAAIPGTALAAVLDGARTHSYRIDMAAGQYAALTIDQQGVDVVVVLVAPDGRTLRRVDGFTEDRGPEPLPFIAGEAGSYRVEVRSPGAAAHGSYTIALDALRPPTPADRSLVAAEETFAAGEVLRRQGGRPALQGAVERHLRALDLLRPIGATGREADVLLSLGSAYSDLGEYAQARGAYGRALDLFRAAGRSRESLPALSGLGRAHRILGQPGEALRRYREALALSRKLGARRQEIELLGNLGRVHASQGKVEEALAFYDQALAGWRELGVAREQAASLNQLGRLYLQLGEVSQAIDRFEEARGILQGLEGLEGEARTMGRVLASLGAAYRARGESGRGIEYLKKALRLHRQTGDRRDEAVVLGELGLAHRQAGDLEAARRYYREALVIHRALGNRSDEATALLNLGRVHDEMGDPAAAERLYRQALPWLAAAGDRQGEAATLFGLAQARRHLGDPAAARTAIEAALERIESLRAEPAAAELRTSYLASKQQYYAFYVDLLMELHQREPAAGWDVRVFEASERLRTRSLLDELAGTGEPSGHGPLTQEEEKEEADLARRLDTLELRRMELAAAKDANTGRLKTVERELRRVLDRHRRVRAALRGGSASAVSQAAPRRLAEIQRRVLDGDTLLLEYYLGDERSFLWAVTSTSLESFVLPGRAALETAARRAYELLPESHRRTAAVQTGLALQELSRLLLAPVEERLAGRRLLVVADGVLHYIPFAALPVPAKATGELVPLAAGHEIVSLPSASTAVVLRERRSGRRQAPVGVAVLADPVFAAGGGFPRLPFSRQEAEGILALVPADQRLELLGFDAGREAVLGGGLARYRYVHFATHGILDTAYPELSGLVLSQVDRRGRPENGFLRAHEIADLRLAADLVVLSSCRTALGREIRGEGLVGLTRAFLDAGAEGVLVSLWPVEDRATAELMRRFYRGMLQEGLSPAAALRHAQVSLWQERDWQAPYYWAGFALQGEWR
ncbi:MAG: CHAT domain-containing protein [Thermoanaerobaculia bacterium]